MAVLDLLQRLLQRLWCYRMVFNILYGILASTFVASLVALFLECRPLDGYWHVDLHLAGWYDFERLWAFERVWRLIREQRKPRRLAPYVRFVLSPFDCVRTALTGLETGNIVTDVILLVIPFPLFFKANLPIWKRVRLMIIFGLGIFLVGVNIVRLYRSLHPFGLTSAGRLLWSSVEVTVATVVTNLTTLYILVRPWFHSYKQQAAAAPPKGSNHPPPPRQSSWPPSEATTLWEGETTYITSRKPLRKSRLLAGTATTPSTTATVRHDSWGQAPWSGGRDFDTRITSGGSTTNSPSSGILVETVVDQEVEELCCWRGGGGDAASLVTLPPFAKLNSNCPV